MKFKDFINENPMLDDDITPVPTAVENSYKKLSKNDEFEEYKFKSYTIKIYDEDSTAFLVDANDKPLIMTEYDLDDYFDYHLFQNISLEKGTTSKLEKNLVSEFVIELSKLLNADGIISDTRQSMGGKKTWETIIKLIGDKSKVLGIYNNEEIVVKNKEKSIKSIDWFKTISKDIYGSGEDKEQFQLYIVF